MENRIAKLEQKVQILEQYVEGDKRTKLHLVDHMNRQTETIIKYFRRDDQNETDRRSV